MLMKNARFCIGMSVMATCCCLLIILVRNLLFLHLLTMHQQVGPLWDMEWWLIGGLQQIVKMRKIRNACDALWVLMFCLLVHEGEYWHNTRNAFFRVESVTHGEPVEYHHDPQFYFWLIYLITCNCASPFNMCWDWSQEIARDQMRQHITPTLITNLTEIKTRGGDWKQVVEDHVLDSEDHPARLMSNFTISRSLAYNTFILTISSTETSILALYWWVWPCHFSAPQGTWQYIYTFGWLWASNNDEREFAMLQELCNSFMSLHDLCTLFRHYYVITHTLSYAPRTTCSPAPCI